VNKQIIFSGREYYAHAAFWEEKFSSLPDTFRLQTAKPSGQPVLPGPGSFSFAVGKEQQSLMEKYAGEKDLETFMLMLTGFTLLFARYNDSGSVVINTPLININPVDEIWEGRVPLISHISKKDSLQQLLQQVNADALAAYTYQNYPYGKLQVSSEKEAGPMLTNIMVWYKGLHLEPSPSDLQEHDLVISIKKAVTGDINAEITYNSALYNEQQLKKLGDHYNTVLLAFKKLETVFSSLGILAPDEILQQLEAFNHAQNNFPRNKTVIDVFEEQVGLTGTGPALVFGKQVFTYQELDTLSTTLAIYLKNECKVETGSTVGVLMEKSAYSIISLLGILKAGGIYTPIDPSNPEERTRYVIQDAGISTLLTDSDHLFKLENFSGNLFAPDIQLAGLESTSDNEIKKPLPGDTAYLIYTSGSTGKPKGVLIRHQGLLEVALDHVAELKMTKNDRYLQFMSLTFDGSLLDIFTTLLAGSALVLPSKDIINDTAAFINFVEEEQITVFTVTPSYLATLGKAKMNTVHTLVSAGEPANVEYALYYASFKNFYNGYGPSEITVNATLYKVDPAKNYQSIPIGSPRPGKKIFITDSDLNLRPTGMSGEILIGGTALAIGYLNDEVLTSEKFIPSPFDQDQLVYRTGDTGRWLPDGNIEFTGRIDEQVKINGFRIDTGEIENVLHAHEQVGEARVLVKEDDKAKALVAFYTRDNKMECVPSLGEYFIYDHFIYESMATDSMRLAAYKKGLEAIVKDKVVLDPGTGSEMILARHCIEAGAQKVYAVEMDEDAFDKATKNLEKLGLAGKIILIKGNFESAVLPEKIDCVVSALAGNMASSDGCIPLIQKLKKNLNYPVRFLPERYVTMMAAVSIPEEKMYNGFSTVSAYYIQQVFDKTGYPFDLRVCIKNFDTGSIISEYKACEDIVYGNEPDTDEKMQLNLRVTNNAVISGFVFWINAYFNGEVLIDSKEHTHHLPVYFPVFGKEVKVEAGDEIEVVFSRTLSDNGINPDYKLEGRIKTRQQDILFNYSSFNHLQVFRSNAFYRRFFTEQGIQTLNEFSAAALRTYLAEYLPAYMVPSRLYQVENFPMTANGKIDKKILLAMDADDEMPLPAIALPETDVEKHLAEIWASVLGKQQVSIADDFFMAGGDSIKAIQIASRMLKAGYKVEVKHIFENPVLSDLAKAVTPVNRIADQLPVSGPVKLTPIQKEVFVTDMYDRHHFNQAMMLLSENGFGESATRAVFKKIQEHHDALRIVYKEDATGYHLYNQGPEQPLSLSVFNLDDIADIPSFIEEKANAIQAGIDLENGPLMKLGLFQSAGGDRLLIVIHHLVIDTVSWRILLEDIEKLYSQYNSGQNLQLPFKTDSFKIWSERLTGYATSETLLKQKSYWTAVSKELKPVLKADQAEKSNLLSDSGTAVIRISEENTGILLKNTNSVFNSRINDILLTAVAVSIYECFGCSSIPVAMEGHGREELFQDISINRTVGWFTSMYPLILEVAPAGDDPSARVERIRQITAAVPDNGVGYGILKHLSTDTALSDIRSASLPQISFNYLGQFDTDIQNNSYSMAEESLGNTLSNNKHRLFEIDFNAMVMYGVLQVSVIYGKNRFATKTIETICDSLEQTLLAIAAYCAGMDGKQPEVAGFTYKGLTVSDIDSIFG
jgi:amino acid adenylation domain-containing protein/non-ribosomal peptide synthase protein (TIGR01720 family)